jgi:signal transduction histidine kinase
LLFAGFSLASRASSDQQSLSALSPYLATLVETGDRPEVLHVLQGAKEGHQTDLVLVQRNVAFASTRSVSEMDQPFTKPSLSLHFWGSAFNHGSIISSLPVVREGGPSQDAVIYSFTPLAPTLFNALWVSLLSLLGSLWVSYLSARQMRNAIKDALAPLDQLHQEIQGLTDAIEQSSDPIRIRELEEIRRTISKTKLALENARERLAEERAKKLSADSYKKMIHDLHNPAAALRRYVRLFSDPDTDELTRTEANDSISLLADQILNQISAARKNLENQPLALRESDLRDCVRLGSSVVSVLQEFGSQKRISVSLPKTPVIVAHDPALLQRALVNLLENGLEASQGQVTVELEAIDGKALIRVSDDGPGMDESQVSIFFQGRGQSKKAERQAFGLSSANHIVRTHGGKLVYKRSPLGGASFEIRLEAAL